MDFLENENINLRALEPEDLDILYRWENDTSVWQLGNTLAPFSRFVLKQYLENAHRDIYDLRQLRMLIQLKLNQRPIGAIDLFEFDPAHHRAGIGILIADPGDRGKGYAREALTTMKEYAFGVLMLHQLWCNVGAGNHDSLKLFQASGFVPVGEKKDWHFTGQSYENEILLQLIRPQAGD